MRMLAGLHRAAHQAGVKPVTEDFFGDDGLLPGDERDPHQYAAGWQRAR